MTVDLSHPVAHQSVGNGTGEQVLTKLTLALDPLPSSATITNQPRREVHQENPSSSPSASFVEQSLSTEMAYQRANPGPFVPPRMHHVEVQNRRFMVRAVANSRPTPRHEDWAIATIEPLPGNPLNFQEVSGVLDDFFADVARVQTRAIQRTHLGQGLVQFARVLERDRMVLESPHQFGNVSISFTKHNQGKSSLRSLQDKTGSFRGRNYALQP